MSNEHLCCNQPCEMTFKMTRGIGSKYFFIFQYCLVLNICQTEPKEQMDFTKTTCCILTK